jgi:hypothetical protein
VVYADDVNPLNAELNPIFHLVALLGAHHFVHVSRIKVNILGGSVHTVKGNAEASVVASRRMV